VTKKKSKKIAKGRTLEVFIKDSKRADCEVCRISIEIRGQMAQASKKKINRDTVIQWLKTDFGIIITNEQLNLHYSGKHDSR
jgi:hypothetical protein